MRRTNVPYQRTGVRIALLSAAIVSALAACSSLKPPPLPAYDATNGARVEWLDQNWKPDERAWYHNGSQGTLTLLVPYRWFLALERPKLSGSGGPALLRDDEFLSRVGFMLGEKNEYNPEGLPIGFARYQGTHPVTAKPIDGLGLNCAACHTGQINYNGKRLGIDGGPATVDLYLFTRYLGTSMLATLASPVRFGRFADRVLGPDHTSDQKKALRAEFKQLLDFIVKQDEMMKMHGDANVAEGFARLDALNRIGNQVFSVDQNSDVANHAAISAPVAFPHIWDTSWFEWVQYDASIMQPMVRNVGEALGVLAVVNMSDPDKPLWATSADVKNIHWMESMLAGLGQDFDSTVEPYKAKAFQGLRSPKWPQEVLGKIDRDKAAKGGALYAELCQGCHLPPVDSPEFWSDKHWNTTYTPASEYRDVRLHDTPTNCTEGFNHKWRLLDLYVIPLEEIGTDPAQAEILIERKVTTPEFLGIDTDNYGLALGAVVEKVNDHWYATQDPPITGEVKSWWDGERPNCLQEPRGYKARPLDGVWATPPFLHNGSVPTLYHLLSPVAERPKTFYLGSKEFDPTLVGYSYAKAEGLFELDTSIPGNLNTGHEFNDGSGKGIIDRKLTEEERWQLVEYLKTL
jgi:mono/diheme cytochrome c family protein